MQKRRIYIAGKYSAPSTLETLNNIHDGIHACVRAVKSGYSPYCPWLDHQYHLIDKTITVKDYQRISMDWLEVSQEVWVLPNSESSKGTQAEILRAQELRIPVRYLSKGER